jgi:hypothetical protein
MEWIKEHYGLDTSIKKGTIIKFMNMKGIIMGNKGAYFKIKMQEGYLKGTKGYYHPLWRLKYKINNKFIKPKGYTD